MELGAHSDGQCDVLLADVSGAQAVSDRDAEFADDPLYHFLELVSLIMLLHAVQHLPEDNAAKSGKFSCELQLHQHAIDLKRLRADVLDEQDGVICADRVRSSDGCGEHR